MDGISQSEQVVITLMNLGEKSLTSPAKLSSW